MIGLHQQVLTKLTKLESHCHSPTCVPQGFALYVTKLLPCFCHLFIQGIWLTHTRPIECFEHVAMPQPGPLGSLPHHKVTSNFLWANTSKSPLPDRRKYRACIAYDGWHSVCQLQRPLCCCVMLHLLTRHAMQHAVVCRVANYLSVWSIGQIGMERQTAISGNIDPSRLCRS